MSRSLSLITLLVDDYDVAKSHYCDSLGFVCVEDKPLTPDGSKRWVVVHPSNPSNPTATATSAGAAFLLAKASTPEQKAAMGNQTGGRVSFFLETDNFGRDHAALTSKGVKFREEPRYEVYGTVAVFEDRYGNAFDLIEKK